MIRLLILKYGPIRLVSGTLNILETHRGYIKIHLVLNQTLIMESKISVYSYNSWGFNVNQQEVNKILNTSSENCFPIIFNQENFVLSSNSYIIRQTLQNSQLSFKRAVKDTYFCQDYANKHYMVFSTDSMFMSISNHLSKYVKDVSPNYWRLQAITLNISGRIILIINTYFPNDPQTDNFVDFQLLEILNRFFAFF